VALLLISAIADLVNINITDGDVTFAAAEKLQQRSRQRDDDMHALALQIQRLEVSRFGGSDRALSLFSL